MYRGMQGKAEQTDNNFDRLEQLSGHLGHSRVLFIASGKLLVKNNIIVDFKKKTASPISTYHFGSFIFRHSCH